jgi:cobalamin biosynthesis protein CobT
LGTALCFGTALGAGTVFVYTTGITDAPTFGRVTKEKIAALGIIPPLQPETEEQRVEREQLEDDAAKAYDEIFGDDKKEGENNGEGEGEGEQSKKGWQDKLARIWDLKKILDKSMNINSNNSAEIGEDGNQGNQPKKEEVVYSEDKPKWQQKLERIFGLSK